MRKRSGYSIIELVVAMYVFGIAATGIVTGTLQTRKFADNVIRNNTARSAAISYIEQIKDLPYRQLKGIENGDTLPTRALVREDGVVQGVEDPLTVGEMEDRTLIIDIRNPLRQDERTLEMDARFRVDLQPVPLSDRSALQGRITYQFQPLPQEPSSWKEERINFVITGSDRI